MAYFRDGNGADVLCALVESRFQVVCFGHHDGTAGVEVRPFEREPFLGAVSAAKAVVCSAGSNLLAEAIMLGKPVLALHHAGDYEQAANAALVQGAGLGVAATFEADARSLVARFRRWVDGETVRRLDLRSLMPPVSRVVTDLVDELGAS